MSSDRLKIAVLGAGCFALGPSVLHDALLAHKLPDLEIALVDADEEAVFAMADLGRRMAAKTKLDPKITAHIDREAALAGACYVLAGPTIARPAPRPSEVSDALSPTTTHTDSSAGLDRQHPFNGV